MRFSGTKTYPADHYRAVYLTERTVLDLIHKICEKQQIDPSRVISVLRVNQDGLKMMMTDDVVRELSEGQDMVANIREPRSSDGVDADLGPGGVEINLSY